MNYFLSIKCVKFFLHPPTKFLILWTVCPTIHFSSDINCRVSADPIA